MFYEYCLHDLLLRRHMGELAARILTGRPVTAA